MAKSCAQCGSQHASIAYSRALYCTPCRRAERELLQRAEVENWLGSARIRSAALGLNHGSGFYLDGLREFAAVTGWVPHFNQSRLCCPRLITHPFHHRTFDCARTRPWPVRVEHPVLLTKGGMFALLSQPTIDRRQDRPYLIDARSPYGHFTVPLLVTPDNVAAATTGRVPITTAPTRIPTPPTRPGPSGSTNASPQPAHSTN